MSYALLNLGVDEDMREKLLAEELKLRSRQPEAWTKTKFRKYANFGRNRKKADETVVAEVAQTASKAKKTSKKK